MPSTSRGWPNSSSTREGWALECTVLEHLAEQVGPARSRASGSAAATAKHYVSSKVMTWVRLRPRQSRAREKFGFKAPLEKWRNLARHHPSRCLRKRPLTAKLNSFVESYGSKTAGCQHPVLLAIGGISSAVGSPCARKTLQAIERQPDAGTALCCGTTPAKVLRRTANRSKAHSWPAASGLPTPIVLTGEFDKAQALFPTASWRVANDLGLLAEEFDSGAGRQTGNFPQALTHIALINTAHNLSAAKQSTEEASDAAVKMKAGT